MKELIKRVDPQWLRIWLVCYGGSLSILAAYLMSAAAATLVRLRDSVAR